jgi:hypothetical protein
MPNDSILAIDEEKFLAKGAQRIVYVHPDDAGKVLKLIREDQTPEKRRARRWIKTFRSLKTYDQNMQDYLQHQRLKKKKHTAKCVYEIFGYIETTLGPALETEHIRDADGNSSETLKEYVRHNGVERLSPLIEELFVSLRANHVVIRELHLKNILVRKDKDGTLDLVVIDGLGDANLIPCATYSRFFNQRKLVRKKAKLHRKLDDFLTELSEQEEA